MNKIKNFFKLLSFELKKIYRSKIVFLFLIFAPVVLVVTFGFISKSMQASSDNFGSLPKDIVFVNENENISSTSKDLLKEIFGESANNIVWENDLEKQIIRLKLTEISLIINMDENSENGVTVIYDNSSDLSAKYKDALVQNGYQTSYLNIKQALSEYGITIEDYVLNISPLTNEEFNIIKRLQPVSFCMILAFVLLIGISYTMARDNETGIIKQLSYTPIKINTYLSVRALFFIILGIIQTFAMLCTYWILGVPLGKSFLGLFLIGSVFTFAFSSLGLLLSTTKNQLSAISLGVVFIIVPTIIGAVGFSGADGIIKAFLLISPISAAIMSHNSYLYFGIFNVGYLCLLVCQAVIYYLIALYIMKKRSGKRKKYIKTIIN